MALLYAALACAIRPTNAVIWVYLLLALFRKLRHHKDVIMGILLDTLVVG
jgi:GPI mannosyltransferase 3